MPRRAMRCSVDVNIHAVSTDTMNISWISLLNAKVFQFIKLNSSSYVRSVCYNFWPESEWSILSYLHVHVLYIARYQANQGFWSSHLAPKSKRDWYIWWIPFSRRLSPPVHGRLCLCLWPVWGGGGVVGSPLKHFGDWCSHTSGSEFSTKSVRTPVSKMLSWRTVFSLGVPRNRIFATGISPRKYRTVPVYRQQYCIIAQENTLV